MNFTIMWVRDNQVQDANDWESLLPSQLLLQEEQHILSEISVADETTKVDLQKDLEDVQLKIQETLTFEANNQNEATEQAKQHAMQQAQDAIDTGAYGEGWTLHHYEYGFGIGSYFIDGQWVKQVFEVVVDENRVVIQATGMPATQAQNGYNDDGNYVVVHDAYVEQGYIYRGGFFEPPTYTSPAETMLTKLVLMTSDIDIKVDFSAEELGSMARIAQIAHAEVADGKTFEELVGQLVLMGTTLTWNNTTFATKKDVLIQRQHTPNLVPSVFKVVPNGIANWYGGKSYPEGAKVIHDGYIWLSGVNGNIWMPGGVGVHDHIWRRLEPA